MGHPKGIYVPGVGNHKANIIFVGEAPGAQEEQFGKPFIGPSGSLFRSCLAKLGILDTDVYITNVCHYRPPGNRIDKWLKFKGTGRNRNIVGADSRISEGIVELFRDIAEIKPNVIVPLGNTALWALSGLRQIGRRRGSIIPVSWDLKRAAILDSYGHLRGDFVEHLSSVIGTKIIPTIHPAAVLRQFDQLAVFQTDLRRIIGDSKFPELRLPEYEIIINPEGPALDKLHADLLQGQVLAYDIECVASRLYCVGFARDRSYVLTLTANTDKNVEVIRSLLTSDIPKIAQNGFFDKSFLAMYAGITVENYRHDTMVAQHCAYPELRKGLDFLASIYTREPYYKDEGKDWSKKDAEDIHRFLTYNAKDVYVTIETWGKLDTHELKDPAYREVYERNMKAAAAYVDMAIYGILIDLAVMENYEKQYLYESLEAQNILDKTILSQLGTECVELKEAGHDKDADSLEAFIRKIAGGIGTEQGAVNVNSTSIMPTLLYDILGFKEKRTKNQHGKMVRTTNEDALKELFTETGSRILLTMVKIRQKRKRISSYLRVKVDSRNFTYFAANPVRAKTGRSSIGKTTTGYGLNLQTIPHELRDMYIAEPGYEFGYWDYSQAEAYIIAYQAGIRKMIAAFESPSHEKFTPGDVHSVTCHEVLGINYGDIKEYPHRYLGKQCNHAFNYEMGPYKFWKLVTKKADETGIQLSRSEAKAMREAHFRAYPELEQYWEWIRGQLKRDRTIINPLGRKRVFLGRMDQDTFREAYNHFAQSTVADMVRIAVVSIHHDLVLPTRRDYPRTRIVLEVHDALLMHYPIELRDSFTKTGLEMMNIPLRINDRTVTIPTEAEYGRSWGSDDLTTFNA